MRIATQKLFLLPLFSPFSSANFQTCSVLNVPAANSSNAHFKISASSSRRAIYFFPFSFFLFIYPKGDRGSKSSRVYQHEGLLYRILNEQGNNIGVPIKASSFYSKPTLKYLREKFSLNETARQSHKQRVKNAINLAFLKQPKQSLSSLIKALGKEGINTVVRQLEME